MEHDPRSLYKLLRLYLLHVPVSGRFLFYRRPLDGTDSDPIRFSDQVIGWNVLKKVVRNTMEVGEFDGYYTNRSLRMAQCASCGTTPSIRHSIPGSSTTRCGSTSAAKGYCGCAVPNTPSPPSVISDAPPPSVDTDDEEDDDAWFEVKCEEDDSVDRSPSVVSTEADASNDLPPSVYADEDMSWAGAKRKATDHLSDIPPPSGYTGGEHLRLGIKCRRADLPSNVPPSSVHTEVPFRSGAKRKAGYPAAAAGATKWPSVRDSWLRLVSNKPGNPAPSGSNILADWQSAVPNTTHTPSATTWVTSSGDESAGQWRAQSTTIQPDFSSISTSSPYTTSTSWMAQFQDAGQWRTQHIPTQPALVTTPSTTTTSTWVASSREEFARQVGTRPMSTSSTSSLHDTPRPLHGTQLDLNTPSTATTSPLCPEGNLFRIKQEDAQFSISVTPPPPIDTTEDGKIDLHLDAASEHVAIKQDRNSPYSVTPSNDSTHQNMTIGSDAPTSTDTTATNLSLFQRGETEARSETTATNLAPPQCSDTESRSEPIATIHDNTAAKSQPLPANFQMMSSSSELPSSLQHTLSNQSTSTSTGRAVTATVRDYQLAPPRMIDECTQTDLHDTMRNTLFQQCRWCSCIVLCCQHVQ